MTPTPLENRLTLLEERLDALITLLAHGYEPSHVNYNDGKIKKQHAKDLELARQNQVERDAGEDM